MECQAAGRSFSTTTTRLLHEVSQLNGSFSLTLSEAPSEAAESKEYPYLKLPPPLSQNFVSPVSAVALQHI